MTATTDTSRVAEAIADVVVEFGMWLTSRKTRIARCTALADDGATPAAIEEIGVYIEEQAGHDAANTGARLNAILKPGEWRDALRAARATESRRPAEPTPSHAPNMFPDEPAERGDNHNAGAAFAMLAFDRKTPSDVADALGVSLADIPRLVREGAAIYRAEDPEGTAQKLLAQ